MRTAASTTAAVSGPPAGVAMADVNQQLVDVIALDWWRRLDRARLPRLIALTDAMLEALEQMNLADVTSVSAEWRERLVLLFANLPFECRPRLRAFPSPTEVLDVIFAVQEGLFALRNDGGLEIVARDVGEPKEAAEMEEIADATRTGPSRGP